MGLYERLMSFESPTISPHRLFGVMQEIALGNMNAAQGAAALSLNAAEQAEANTLLGVINAQPTADARKLKAVEFERVGFLASRRIVPFDTVPLVKARYGV